MSANPDPQNTTLRMALALADAGYLVFPCLPHSKAPATPNGFHDATIDPGIIQIWFDNAKGFNLAIACGPQPNGVNLFALDIDPKKGGNETWAALTAIHGVPLAPRHDTPSGGFHLFFDAPAGVRSSQNRLGPGIDHRCEGGYVVVPPSRLVNETGELIRYKTDRDAALIYLIDGRWLPRAIPGLPLWIIEGLVPEAPHVEMPRSSSGDDMFEWLKAHFDWVAELEADGWTLRSRHGDELRFTRPDKSTRDGSSGSVWYIFDPKNSIFNIFSSTVWDEMPVLRDSQIGRGVVTWTPFDYLQRVRFGGSFERTEEYVLRLMGRTPVRASSEAPPADATSLCLPLDFYDQRPWMAMCRQMAQAVGGSPGAHLLAYMTRWATLIPPGYTIPPINGADSNLSLIGVIAGVSGAGKTSPMSNARKMLPFIRKDVVEVPGLGSGEGILERFYGVINSVDDEGKKRQVRGRTVFGAHFAISEGLIFAELSQRAGTNHATRFCDAWSGAPLATPNAGADTYRQIDAWQYQLTAMMGIQADKAHELMTDSLQSQGFVGRLLFCWTEEPRVKPRPEWPEPVILPVPDAFTWPGTSERPWPLYQQVYLEYPDEIVTECQDASDQRVGTDVPVEDHHHDLMRLKVAGILALMDDRLFVNLDDWAIATTICETSKKVRLHLYSLRLQKNRAQRHTAAVARAEAEIVVDSIKERQNIASMANNIRRTVKEPWAEGALRKKVSSHKTRGRFEPALELAVANGWVTVGDGRVFPA